jgi:hypothetical protein
MEDLLKHYRRIQTRQVFAADVKSVSELGPSSTCRMMSGGFLEFSRLEAIYQSFIPRYIEIKAIQRVPGMRVVKLIFAFIFEFNTRDAFIRFG